MIKLLSKIFIKNYKDYSNNDVREKYSILTGVVGIVFNIICSAMKVIVGAISGSIAILSDGLNNIADMASSIVSILSAKLSNMKPDKDHPFGHGRVEYIGSLVVSFLIMFMGVELLIESVKKIINPEPIDFSISLIIVLGISIAIKIYMYIYNNIYAKKTNSLVLKATAMDSLYDSITTTVILIATILSQFVDFPLDGIGGCVVGGLIFYGGFGIAKEAVVTLLGVPPTKETIDNIINTVTEPKEILGTHDLMVHDYGPGRQFASVHAEVDENGNMVELHEVIDAVEMKVFGKYGIQLTVHMDPISVSKETLKHKELIEEAIKEVDKDFKLHDFRMVNGENQINVIFDLVIPHSYLKKDKDEVVRAVRKAIKSKNSKYFAVIQVECDYA